MHVEEGQEGTNKINNKIWKKDRKKVLQNFRGIEGPGKKRRKRKIDSSLVLQKGE